MVHLLIALYAAAFALATGKVRSETRARIDAMRDHPFPPTGKPRDPRALTPRPTSDGEAAKWTVN